MSASRFSLLVVVVIALALALTLGVGAARADGPPIVIPVAVQIQAVNPCTGELDTVSLTGVLRVHEFYNEAGDVHHTNVTALTDVESAAGFLGQNVQVFVHNADGPFAPREEEARGMQLEIQNVIARNPDTGQTVRLHVTFRLVYVSEEENVVEAISVTLECLGPA
jgi:hypothetical protein